MIKLIASLFVDVKVVEIDVIVLGINLILTRTFSGIWKCFPPSNFPEYPVSV